MSAAPRAPALGLIGCEGCGLVLRRGALTPEHDHGHCPRCHEPLHARRPDAIRRSWAYLLAAAALYLPANLLPMLVTTLGLKTKTDTILSGVIALWNGGSWDLALIVFIASVVVPLLKVGALALILVTTQRGSDWHTRERAQLYRILEFIGHWSMLDVFAVALLVALVHFGPLAQVQPGPGIVAFGAVVVLTMLATQSFDPRLIWDAAQGRPSKADAQAAAPAGDPSPSLPSRTPLSPP